MQKLIERIKIGDNNVLGDIYTEYRKPFLRFGSNFNLNKEELLDIYQDSIIAFVDNVRNGKIETLTSSLKTYIFSIGKFIAFKRMKHLGKMEQFSLDANRLNYYIQEIENNNDYDKYEMELFRQCFKQMGKQCQKILNLYYYRGFSLEEIQENLDYENYNVVKSQKSRCIKHLKSLIVAKKNER